MITEIKTLILFLAEDVVEHFFLIELESMREFAKQIRFKFINHKNIPSPNLKSQLIK